MTCDTVQMLCMSWPNLRLTDQCLGMNAANMMASSGCVTLLNSTSRLLVAQHVNWHMLWHR
jgi:hypothetical protein